MTDQSQDRPRIPIDVDLNLNVTEHIRRVYEGDQRPPARERSYYDVPRDPYAWTTGKIIGLVAVSAVVIVVLGWFTALVSNGGSFSCDTQCWQTKKEVALAKYTADRAIANSDANARAGFGNDDETTKQTAVLPRPTVSLRETAPNVTIERVAPPVVPCTPYCGKVTITQPPPCATCGSDHEPIPECRPGFHPVPPPAGYRAWCAPNSVVSRL